jgi:hypothetical protein
MRRSTGVSPHHLGANATDPGPIGFSFGAGDSIKWHGFLVTFVGFLARTLISSSSRRRGKKVGTLSALL